MKIRKVIGMLMILITALVVSATTALGSLGEAYTIYGVELGYWLIGVAVIIVIVAWLMQITKKAIRPLAPIIAGMVIAGIVLVAPIDTTPAVTDVTEDITWTVTAESNTSDTTIDNDARTITKLIYADVDLEVINETDDSVWVDATDDPTINFTISPAMAVGLSTTTNQATTQCSVLTPDQDFTEDSTEYDLFEDVSSGGDKNLVWTADGTDEYESTLCTVTIGSSEVAKLVVNYLDDGLSQLEAGESFSTQISIGGITYTLTIIVTALT